MQCRVPVPSVRERVWRNIRAHIHNGTEVDPQKSIAGVGLYVLNSAERDLCGHSRECTGHECPADLRSSIQYILFAVYPVSRQRAGTEG